MDAVDERSAEDAALVSFQGRYNGVPGGSAAA